MASQQLAETIQAKTEPELYICYKDFFSEEFVSLLREQLFASSDQFKQVQFDKNGKPNLTYGARHCRVNLEVRIPELKEKVMNLLPDLLTRLNIPKFTLGRFEMQASSYVDGGIFVRHRDAGNYPSVSSLRILSYVYYIHQEPRLFSGGELCLYHPDSGECVFKALPPSNSIIFFPSRLEHEVLPIKSEYGEMRLGRCTVNGWLSKRNLMLQGGQRIKRRYPELLRPYQKIFVRTLLALQKLKRAKP